MAAHQNINADQLKLFMTPQEIYDNFAPVEGDRMLHGSRTFYQGGAGMGQRENLGPDPRYGEMTQRPRRTDEEPNFPLYKEPWVTSSSSGRQRPGFFRRRSNALMRGELLQPETNEQMAERKLKEAQTPGRSGYEKPLVEHIKEHGVEHPIPLGLEAYSERTGDPRPMLAGGQHRIAAQHHLDPNALMPVEYHKNIRAAQAEKGYR